MNKCFIEISTMQYTVVWKYIVPKKILRTCNEIHKNLLCDKFLTQIKVAKQHAQEKFFYFWPVTKILSKNWVNFIRCKRICVYLCASSTITLPSDWQLLHACWRQIFAITDLAAWCLSSNSYFFKQSLLLHPKLWLCWPFVKEPSAMPDYSAKWYICMCM